MVGWGLLDDAPEIHDSDIVRNVPHDRKVVRDEYERQVILPLQSRKEVQDLRLDRNIESRDRLIANDQFWLQGECPGNPKTLTLATGKLMRIKPIVLRSQANLLEQLRDPISACGRCPDFQHVQRFPDALTSCQTRIERRVGILEDNLDTPPDLPKLFALLSQHVLAIKQCLSGRSVNQSSQCQSSGGLTAAAFAYQT